MVEKKIKKRLIILIGSSIFFIILFLTAIQWFLAIPFHVLFLVAFVLITFLFFIWKFTQKKIPLNFLRNENYKNLYVDALNERKKSEQRLIAQYSATRVLSEENDVKEAVQKLIKAICESLQWEFGAVWMIDATENVLRCAGFWVQPYLHATLFIDATRNMTFTRGIGLPGRVWSSGKPSWVIDVVKDPNFPRAPYAKEADLHSGFAFPILLQNKILGIIEFFTHQKQLPDKDLLNMMAVIGPQVGLFIQRKQSEKDLRDSEAYKTSIFESVYDSIMTVNDQGIILSCNASTTNIFHYTPEELINKNVNKIVPQFSKQIEKFSRENAIELSGIRKNGQTFPIEITVSKMNLDKPIYVYIIRDITERKKIDTVKNEFVSVVSHELRTPLTSIKGAIGLLIGKYSQIFPEKAKELLNIADENCERLIRLINDILDIEKIESGKMSFQFKTINMKDVLHDSIKFMEIYANKFKVKLTVLNEIDAFIIGDHDKLIAVLTNLLSNAIKFSKEKGEVLINMVMYSQFVRTSIQDTGEGMSIEFQKTVFEKFSREDSTASRKAGGTGLGLSISKSIIENHHGTINFYSEKNIGTTFYFDLPLIKEENNQFLNSKENKLRILVCENDIDCAHIIKSVLEENNFLVDIANTEAEATILLSKNQYACMTLDILLPDKNGILFLKELQKKKEFYNFPTIVISALKKEKQEELKGIVFPIIGWIEKPIDYSILNKLLQKVKLEFYRKKPLILHVEDDKNIYLIIKQLLENKADVIFANTIHSAKEWLEAKEFNLVILDLKLPDGLGTELLPCINFKTQKPIPVLVFSAYETDQKFAKHIYATLTKSETTNQQLVNVINAALQRNSHDA